MKFTAQTRYDETHGAREKALKQREVESREAANRLAEATEAAEKAQRDFERRLAALQAAATA